MQTKDFHFDLPEDLIAQHPDPERGADRLLVLDRGTQRLDDRQFAEIPDLVESGTVMVFNDSRVRKARIYAKADSSGNEAEFLLITRPDPANSRVWKAMARNAKRHKPGRSYRFPDGTAMRILDEGSLPITGSQGGGGEFRYLEFDKPVDDSWLDLHGHLPLPPYIKREDSQEDSRRYQTVYAKNTGSVAAPTAGLHFTNEVLSRLDAKGVIRASVTLHVGLGTFLPVRTERIEDHVMHEETYSVSAETARLVNLAKADGRTVLAVGTTSVRTLESAWDERTGMIVEGDGATSIFMYPGYVFKVVDSLFTNFHTPESTLLMLVSAFAGKERILEAYAHAIDRRYRFFSYGDSMLIR